MSELDLGLKVGVRRLFWAMGMSTRLDVQLRGFSPPPHVRERSRAPETFTDLDVLGFSVADGYDIASSIADCKTSRKESTSRTFWVRGVADLFRAERAYLVREHEVSDAARQLSARLGVAVLTADDLRRTQEFYKESLPALDGPLGLLFERSSAAEHLSAFRDLDRRLKPLLDFREFDFWVIDEHRAPVQLVAHLAAAGTHLDPRDPAHTALVLDLAWLCLLSMIRVTEHVRRAFLADPDRALQEYLFGGAPGLREKQETARLLQGVAPDGTGVLDYLPNYYSQMRELTVRLLRRPRHMQAALRYLELSSALAAARRSAPLAEILSDGPFDAVAAKLASDVTGFLVSAAGLDAGFRTRSRAYLLAERPSAVSTGPPASVVDPTSGASDDRAGPALPRQVSSAIPTMFAGGSASAAGAITRVPRTEAERELLLLKKPGGWEYLYFASELLRGRDALGREYRDHEMRHASPTDTVIRRGELAEYLQGATAAASRLAGSLGQAMDSKVQEKAFGAPGQSGDAERILHMAMRWTSVYRDFMDWSAKVRGTVVPSAYEYVVAALARYSEASVENYRGFVDRLVEQVDRVPAALEAGEPVTVEMELVLEIPENVQAEFDRALQRALREEV